ncbi:MAG TPA: carboxypeptidase-like regulatory domain-containing protein, partial [Vicinamibacterales bacterium]
MGSVRRVVLLLAGLMLLSGSAYAQATLAGFVKDTTGAITPGVTVEASSPVLLEKVRTAITDSTGQYRIESLPPGTYTVTFTLPGFAVVKREAVDVSGAGIITINADMRVGTVSETVTVTGETPIVDVQSARRQQVLDSATLSSIPATRGYNAILTAVPSVTGGDLNIDLT